MSTDGLLEEKKSPQPKALEWSSYTQQQRAKARDLVKTAPARESCSPFWGLSFFISPGTVVKLMSPDCCLRAAEVST